MPEPPTRTVPPEPELPPDPTGEWKGPPAQDEPQAVDAPTVTRTVASTPGPQHPERRTDSDDTERDRAATDAELPQIPGFLVQAEIGRGGMGVVYRAVHLEMAKTVALKVVYTLGRDPEMVRARFAREVQALARLEHPNIVPIYHAGQWHGFPYFTMKIVPRGALAKHLGSFRGMPAACARLVAKVARAVQALHDHGVIHRDLKPLNILLGDSDEPLVADFGLAKWIDDDPVTAVAAEYPISGTGVPMGTRPYMAPEQTRGERTEFPEAADIWALGVTLYELLTGVRPFPDDGRSDLAKRICEEPAPALPDTVPAELAAVVGQCLAKRPGDRYASAAAVADDLERWLTGLPVVAPLTSPAPPIEPAPAPKHPRRRRWLVGLALVALGALVAVAAAIFPLREEVKKSIAERLRDGELVTLIGPNGQPLVESRAPPDLDGVLVLGQHGFATLSSAVFAAVELSDEELPWPVRLRAEYAVTGSQDVRSRTGVYVGRKRTPAADPCNSLVQFGHTESTKGPQLTQVAAFESLVWSKRGPESRKTFPAPDPRVTLIPRDPAPLLEWHQVEVVIRPESLTGLWNGLELQPLHAPRRPDRRGLSVEAELEAWGAAWAKQHPGEIPPAFAPPYLGPGIGVYVFNASAVFRNVTLERLSP
jgi:serine/threonine protein kinase